MRDPVQGVLEDEREQEVSHRQPKRVFQARAGRRSRMSCGAEVATRGVLPSYTYSELDRTVILSNFKLSARRGERTVACLSNKVSKTFPTLHQCKQVADALKRLVS